MDEPRAVPFDHHIVKALWYCLDCGLNFVSRPQVQSHWNQAHGDGDDKALNGIDYALGTQVEWMRERREAWIEKQAMAFAGELHQDFGPEDFVAEAEIRDA